nr:protein NUCLEAR FUSION DEFECTIVE 4-like [Ipomoea batatas]
MAKLSRRHMAPIREANQHQLSRLLPSPEVAPLHFPGPAEQPSLCQRRWKLFGWFSGIAALYLPLWLVLLVGFVGYGVQYLFLIEKIASLSYWQVFSSLRSPGTIYAGLTLSLTLSPSRISRWTARSWRDFHQLCRVKRQDFHGYRGSHECIFTY